MQCLNTAAKDMPEADKARRFHPGSSPHPATWSDVWRWAMNIYDGLFENLGEKNAIQWFIIIFPVKVVFLGRPHPATFWRNLWQICGANMGCNPSGFLPVVTSGIAILFTSAVRLSTGVGQVCAFQNCGETKQTEKHITQCGRFVIKIVPMDEVPSFFAFEPFWKTQSQLITNNLHTTSTQPGVWCKVKSSRAP